MYRDDKLNYHYPRQRVCGLFLVGAGITMALSSILGSSQCPNVWVFIIGYFISNAGIMFNKKVRKRFAIGESTAFQEKVSNLSVIFLAVMAVVTGMTLSKTGDFRLIWLFILLEVGVHFIPFSLVHGKLMLPLGMLLIINAVIGIYLSNVSFAVFGIIDAIIKLIIGVMLFELSPKNRLQND